MTVEEIKELAKNDKKLDNVALDKKITELKSFNCGILECVVYVKVNQNCSLLVAKELVINSSAWIEKKDEFIKHQQEMMEEFLLTAKDDIKKIKQTFYPDRTETSIIFNNKNKNNLLTTLFKRWVFVLKRSFSKLKY